MLNKFVVKFQRLLVLTSLLLLAACGGGSGSVSQALPTTVQPQLFIAGAGIKGPLAFAKVELYALDTRFGELYEPGNPIASATTDAYAQITGLAVPTDIAPPYILVIDGTSAIDRNTDLAPVISKLVTVITQESLDSRQPVYATPYTTLAYQMLRLESTGDGSNTPDLPVRVTDPATGSHLDQFNQDILQTIGFNMPAGTNIFTTPPIITDDATNIEKQQLLVNYRAAIEAFSSLLYEMSLSSEPAITTDSLLEQMALDLYSDGVIDNSDSGQVIGGIDTAVLSQNPLRLEIPNTGYLVRDIVYMMEEERSLVGSSSNIEFLINDITIVLEPALLDVSLEYHEEIGYSQPVTNTTNSLLLAGVIAANAADGSEIYRMDLSAYPHNHAITRQEAAEIFQSQSILNSPVAGQPFDAGNIRVVNDPFGGPGKVLSIQFRKGIAGLGTPENPSGGQWKIEFGDAYEDVYMAMELGVDENWITPRGMHLPFLASTPFAASNVPEPDIWANFFQLYGNNSFVNSVSSSVHKNMVDDAFAIYYYTLKDAQDRAWYNTDDPAEYGNSDLPQTGQVQLVRNGYVALEQRLKMNSVPSYDNPETDGLMQAWANGKPAVDKRNFAWRRDASQKMDFVWMGWWTGGPRNSPEWAQPQDQKMYLRSFVVSTKPITH